METKTTKQITEENYDKLDAWFTFPEDSEIQVEAEERWVSVHQIIRWIDNLRKSNDMWRYPVDECFGMLEDAITSDSEPDDSTHNKGYEVNQK